MVPGICLVNTYMLKTHLKNLKIVKKTFEQFPLFFVEQAYTSPASLKCNGHFSCLTKCDSAYVTGNDGCPQCDCVPGACLIMRTWNQKWTENPWRCYVFISLVYCIPPLSNKPCVFHPSCPRTPFTYKILHIVSSVVALCCFPCFHSANKQSHQT